MTRDEAIELALVVDISRGCEPRRTRVTAIVDAVRPEPVRVCKWCAKTDNHRHKRCATREDGGGEAEHVYESTRPRCPVCGGKGAADEQGDNCARCNGFGWLTGSSAPVGPAEEHIASAERQHAARIKGTGSRRPRGHLDRQMEAASQAVDARDPVRAAAKRVESVMTADYFAAQTEETEEQAMRLATAALAAEQEPVEITDEMRRALAWATQVAAFSACDFERGEELMAALQGLATALSEARTEDQP